MSRIENIDEEQRKDIWKTFENFLELLNAKNTQNPNWGIAAGLLTVAYQLYGIWEELNDSNRRRG
jgi:hypothetical protein